VIAIDRRVDSDRGVGVTACFLLGREQSALVAQPALMALQGQNVIGLFVDDLAGEVALASDGVDGDDGALDRRHVEEGWNGNDLVRCATHPGLRQDEALSRREGRHHKDRALAALAPGAPRGLSIDGDDLRCGTDRPPTQAVKQWRKAARSSAAKISPK
jgi:hypothetical protein